MMMVMPDELLNPTEAPMLLAGFQHHQRRLWNRSLHVGTRSHPKLCRAKLSWLAKSVAPNYPYVGQAVNRPPPAEDEFLPL
jgi:hypothetical protein